MGGERVLRFCDRRAGACSGSATLGERLRHCTVHAGRRARPRGEPPATGWYHAPPTRPATGVMRPAHAARATANSSSSTPRSFPGCGLLKGQGFARSSRHHKVHHDDGVLAVLLRLLPDGLGVQGARGRIGGLEHAPLEREHALGLPQRRARAREEATEGLLLRGARTGVGPSRWAWCGCGVCAERVKEPPPPSPTPLPIATGRPAPPPPARTSFTWSSRWSPRRPLEATFTRMERVSCAAAAGAGAAPRPLLPAAAPLGPPRSSASPPLSSSSSSDDRAPWAAASAMRRARATTSSTARMALSACRSTSPSPPPPAAGAAPAASPSSAAGFSRALRPRLAAGRSPVSSAMNFSKSGSTAGRGGAGCGRVEVVVRWVGCGGCATGRAITTAAAVGGVVARRRPPGATAPCCPPAYLPPPQHRATHRRSSWSSWTTAPPRPRRSPRRRPTRPPPPRGRPACARLSRRRCLQSGRGWGWVHVRGSAWVGSGGGGSYVRYVIAGGGAHLSKGDSCAVPNPPPPPHSPRFPPPGAAPTSPHTDTPAARARTAPPARRGLAPRKARLLHHKVDLVVLLLRLGAPARGVARRQLRRQHAPHGVVHGLLFGWLVSA